MSRSHSMPRALPASFTVQVFHSRGFRESLTRSTERMSRRWQHADPLRHILWFCQLVKSRRSARSSSFVRSLFAFWASAS